MVTSCMVVDKHPDGGFNGVVVRNDGYPDHMVPQLKLIKDSGIDLMEESTYTGLYDGSVVVAVDSIPCPYQLDTYDEAVELAFDLGCAYIYRDDGFYEKL